jgi:hypothetical protein
VEGKGKLFEILVEPVVVKSAFLKQGPFESTFLQVSITIPESNSPARVNMGLTGDLRGTSTL